MNPISNIVKDIISEHYAYLSQHEKNRTETERRIAILKAKSHELEANTELSEKYFKYQMDDRKRLFDSASQVLEKAMSLGDIEYAQIAVRVLEVINSKSPFSF